MTSMFRVTKDISGKYWGVVAEVDDKTGGVISVSQPHILGATVKESLSALVIVLRSVEKMAASEDRDALYQTTIILRDALLAGDILNVDQEPWKESLDKKDLQQRYNMV